MQAAWSVVSGGLLQPAGYANVVGSGGAVWSLPGLLVPQENLWQGVWMLGQQQPTSYAGEVNASAGQTGAQWEVQNGTARVATGNDLTAPPRSGAVVVEEAAMNEVVDLWAAIEERAEVYGTEATAARSRHMAEFDKFVRRVG